MIAYRIYTEDINREKVTALVANYVQNFTIYRANGYWRGNAEKSLIIEISGDSYLERVVETIAERIKTFNKQDAVLIQAHEIMAKLV